MALEHYTAVRRTKRGENPCDIRPFVTEMCIRDRCTVARTTPVGTSSSKTTSRALSQVRVMVTGLSGWVKMCIRDRLQPFLHGRADVEHSRQGVIAHQLRQKAADVYKRQGMSAACLRCCIWRT